MAIGESLLVFPFDFVTNFIMIDAEKALLKAIQDLNPSEVRKCIDSGSATDIQDELDRSLLHIAVEIPSTSNVATSNVRHVSAKHDIIYMLTDADVDLEWKDINGKTCLWYAVENCGLQTCEILLQSGADMYTSNLDNDILLHQIFNNTMLYKTEDVDEYFVDDLQDIFEKYYPGLWRAVESQDICQVRRLTNLWCKTNLNKDGKTLKELALDTGHEEIISLIYGIHDTMKLIHHLYAQNTKAVSTMLMTSRKSLQLDLRKMSERGAPILYYLIQWNDAEMIELFIKHGCHVYTVMRDECNCDMPVLFSALEKNVPADVVKALLPAKQLQQEEMLYKLLYKGQTILEVALTKCAALDVFDVIVDRGGPLLAVDRNALNLNVRDVAMLTNKKKYAEIIDKNVSMWITDPAKYPGRRQALALWGYDCIIDAIQNEVEYPANSQVNEFMTLLDEYQNQITELVQATEDGDLEKFTKLQEFSNETDVFERNLCWDGRAKGDGLPLLHRAVLSNHPDLVKRILDKKPDSQSVDTLFDQYHRTALHYASACSSYQEVRKLLLNSGCSEHVLDRKNKEPLDFRDKKDSATMLELIERLMIKEYHLPEPNPWDDDDDDIEETSHQNCHSQKPSYVYSPANHVWTCNSHLIGDNQDDDCNQDYNENDYIEDDTESEPEESGYTSCSIC